jgi:multicomponent Na+:H+ antiporter subunit E
MTDPECVRLARTAWGTDHRQPGAGRSSRVIALIVAIYIFWLVISSSLVPVDLAVGLAIAVVLGLWAERSLWAGEPPMLSLRRVPALMGYLVGLAGHIVMAATHVARIALDPRLPVEPTMFSHRVALRQPLARLLFAQSVTLMPGTATVEMQDDSLLIHSLDERSAEHIRSGGLERRIARVFPEA